MRRMAMALVVTFALGVALGLTATQVLNAQQQPKRTVLQKVDLGDKDGVMWLTELAPGAVGVKHYHPGHEFVYVVAGSVIQETEGKPPVTFKAGDSYHRPPKDVHRGLNASKTEPAKLLVFLLAEKGQPIAIEVK